MTLTPNDLHLAGWTLLERAEGIIATVLACRRHGDRVPEWFSRQAGEYAAVALKLFAVRLAEMEAER